MANYQSHVSQATNNLRILGDLNRKVADSWDWQVTVAYYSAIHIINAHLAKSANLHYSTHEKVKNALSNELSPVKIDESIYLSYVRLENLSRRSRYLCHENDKTKEEQTLLTYSIHLKKAVTALDTILKYFSEKYGINFTEVEIDCIDLKNSNLKYFRYSTISVAPE